MKIKQRIQEIFGIYQRMIYRSCALIPIVLLLLSPTYCTIPSRNLAFEERIRVFMEMGTPDAEIALFNGHDLSGWSAHGLGGWRANNGILTAQFGVGYLATRFDEFEDFILSLDVRVSQRGNSGVFFRAEHPGWSLRPWPLGYEAQVDNNDAKNPTGAIYNIQAPSQVLTRDGEWFRMEVSAIGPDIRVAINGEEVSAIRDDRYERGIIALQLHDPWTRVDFREIRLRIPNRTDSDEG